MSVDMALIVHNFFFFLRADGADDVMLSTIEIRTIALKIEEELYAVFQETGHKYKAKYRSLIFNIKDSRNQVILTFILFKSKTDFKKI